MSANRGFRRRGGGRGQAGMTSGGEEQPPDPRKRSTLKKLGALGALAMLDASILSSCTGRFVAPAHGRQRLILLGIDGLDPNIMGRLLAQGQLPHLAQLRQLGGMREITSTVPPQSPVAWASAITGCDPGAHGICDFLGRDPQTYEPYDAIARVEPPRVTVPAGKWKLPLSSSHVESRRQGRAFWDLLSEQGVPCEVHRVPSNFPPQDSGVPQLAGLGTPDVRGTLGTHTFFTEELAPDAPETHQLLRVQGGRGRGRLRGPRNSLQAGYPETSVDFDLWLDRQRGLVKITVQGKQFLLRKGEWSGWVPVRFTMISHVKTVGGVCQFLVRQTAPSLQLYVSPIHFDPMDPLLPIAAPRDYARELAERYGRFHTLGLPEDTGALEEGALNEDEYLQQSQRVISETQRVYEDLLHERREGVIFCYFGTTDRTQHVFWRMIDAHHPAHRPSLARTYGAVIDDCYRLSDELAGLALEAADGNTSLLVFSDHGFAPFRRRFNLNKWLIENGYLSLRRGAGSEIGISKSADWGATTAYGIGLTGLYLNLKGREAQGIVPPEQRRNIAARLAADLRKLRDPMTGAPVIANVYVTEEAYSATDLETVPDLIVGYARGYRCSSSSAVGVPYGAVLDDNTGTWSGDHCIDREAVPGILFSNRPLRVEKPALPDIAATALTCFGQEVPREMMGKTLW
ncbi:MAG: alkaline phosphatase family protein [Armatimonadetes bacterium]|nr:alkaline phosphatase family protein [Armatimonadota bacterium]